MLNGVWGTSLIYWKRCGTCEFKLAAANAKEDSFSRKPNKMFKNQNELTKVQLEFLESHYQLTAQH
jgi:hypothetical protein